MSQSWVSAEQTFLTLCKLLVILKPGRTRFIRHGRTSFHSVGISLFKKSIALKEINVLLEKIFFYVACLIVIIYGRNLVVDTNNEDALLKIAALKRTGVNVRHCFCYQR